MTNAQKTQLLNKTQEAIGSLLSMFNLESKINILGSEFSLASSGKYHIKVTGKRNANYSIGVSPKATVIEDKECVVYFLHRSNGKEVKHFTAFDGQVVELEYV